jgi:surface polysaccharide O-acyltransferase-like enzyme
MNAFSLCSGHSTLWLSVLYLCGGYLKKYFGQRIEDGLIRKKAIVCYVMMIFATWLSALVISITTTIVLGKSAWTTILIADNSPTIVLASISLLLLFSSIKVTKTKKKILRIVSPCSFGVYLVHVHPLIWKNILKNCMINNLHLPMLLFVAKVMCHVITIYIICFIIEKIREIFFSRCKVYLVSNIISQFVMNQATNIFNITLNSRQ